MMARFTVSGQGAPAWARRRSESKRSSTPRPGFCSIRCRCVGTRKVVVGRRLRIVSSAVDASKRLRMASEPPARSVPLAKRMDTVWYIGEQTMCRSVGVEVPDRGLVLEHPAGRRLVPQAGGDAFGPAGRARRVVHRAGERVRGELGRRARLYEVVQVPLGEDADGGTGVFGEVVALDAGEGGVEHDGDEADAGRAQCRTYEVGRRAQGEGDPVTPAAALGEQGAGGATLAVLGVGGVQDLDGGGEDGMGAGASPGTGAGYARTPLPLRLLPRGHDLIWRRRRAGPGVARTGETGRGADRCRYLDGLGHRRLPWAAGRVDEEPRGREDGDAAGLRLGPRAAGRARGRTA